MSSWNDPRLTRGQRVFVVVVVVVVIWVAVLAAAWAYRLAEHWWPYA